MNQAINSRPDQIKETIEIIVEELSNNQLTPKERDDLKWNLKNLKFELANFIKHD